MPTIRCYANGTSGPRVQLLYVHGHAVNDFTALRSTMRYRAAQVEAMADASARQTGGRRHVRWVTNPDCTVSVRSVEVTSAELRRILRGEYAEILFDRGFDHADRKYLAWIDDGTDRLGDAWFCSGNAWFIVDDSPGAANLNEHVPGYGIFDRSCLDAPFDGRVEAHEMMHTLGSVQDSAPHTTQVGHCRDEHDIMCYADGGRPLLVPAPCPSENAEFRFDCRKDDYFNANPTGSNYLVTHWNTATSRYLTSSPGIVPTLVPPRRPTVRVTAVQDRSVSLAWVPPGNDGGAPITSYRLYRDGAVVATVDATERSFSDRGLVNLQSYQYEVAAVNAVGEGPRSTPVAATPGAP